MSDSLKNYYKEYEDGDFIKEELVYQISDAMASQKYAIKEDVTQIEAKYNTDGTSWKRYISSNLTTPDRFIQNMKRGNYVVTVSFTIGKTGKVQDVILLKSVEWSADAEVFRVIENSPVWTPAVQDGKPVLYKQKQNIVFAIDY